MYFCGPTVYARAHIGNARPFVIGMWLRSWLRARGYDAHARPQHHGHQRQDLRRRAGRERRARRARDRVVPGGHRRPRARHAGPPAEGDESVPQIVRFIEELIARGYAYPARRRRLLPRRELPRVRAALGPAARPGRAGRGAERAQGGSARLRALEGEQAGTEDTWWDSPWGRGRPGWHIECSAMAEEISARRSRSTAAGSTSSSRTTRTRSRSRARSGIRSRRSGRTTGCSGSPARRCRSRSGNVETIREAIDEWGRETMLALLPDRALAQADRLLGRDDGAGEGAARRRCATRSAARRPSTTRAAGTRSRPRSTTTSTRRTRWRSCTSGPRRGQLELLRRGPRRLRARRRSPSASEAPAEVVELAERRGSARGPSGTSRGRPAARRARAAGWEMRDEPGGGFDARPRSVTPRARLRAPGGARGAARPPGGARALGDRAGARVGGLAGRGRARRSRPSGS